MKKAVLWICVLLFSVLPTMGQKSVILNQIKDTVACRQWVDEQLASMSLKKKIGQLFIHTVAPIVTQQNQQNIASAVKTYGVGGLLFSGGEVQKQVFLTNYAQEMAQVPLMVTFDGEWGLAMRLKRTSKFPRNRVLGCIENDSILYEYGREVARQLREIGVTVNFAPVADVDNNPRNPVINTRSFGSRPDAVARKVVAYSRGLQDGGVLAVCKHFPGHGDTEVDSHKSLPILYFDRKRLDAVELHPFRKAIASGVDGVMMGHLRVPALDERPASISNKIVKGLLKDELGYKGLVFTDALEMKGISNNKDVSAQALIAGCDLLLVPRNLKRELQGVLNAVKTGAITEEQITEKCRKVLTYKYALGLNHRPRVDVQQAEKQLNRAYTNELMQRIDYSAVTVVKDSDEALPLDLSLSGTVVLSLSPTLSQTFPFYKTLNAHYPVTWIKATPQTIAEAKRRIRPAQRVIVTVHTSKIEPYLGMLTQLAKDKPFILVCFESIKTLKKLAPVVVQSSAVILAHKDTKDLQQHVANLLLGKEKATGTLSVGLNDEYPAGSGVIIDPNSPRKYTPEEFGMRSKVLHRIDSIALEGIRKGAYPGCHVLVTKNGYPVYNKCFGTRTYESKEPVRENDIYDLASLSKTTGTLLAVMKLYDDGKLTLTDRVEKYLPMMKGPVKRTTIQQLLYHETGLPAYYPFYQKTIDKKTCKGGMYKKYKDANHRVQVGQRLFVCTKFSYLPEWISHTPSEKYTCQIADSLYIKSSFRDEVLKEIDGITLKSRTYRYSCLNFMLLKEIVEHLAGKPMDEYLDSVYYQPMGLSHTAYNPLRKFKKEQILPTVKEDFLRGKILQGYVHDEAAAFLGGVSGNAGLFSTAREVAMIYQMLIDKGICGDRRYLSRATCELFLTVKSRNSRRGLGFDRPDTEHPTKGPCSENTPACVIGHTGFTGTCAWADPTNELVYVFLSNRTYPNPFMRKNLMRLDIRENIQDMIYQSIIE